MYSALYACISSCACYPSIVYIMIQRLHFPLHLIKNYCTLAAFGFLCSTSALGCLANEKVSVLQMSDPEDKALNAKFNESFVCFINGFERVLPM